MSAAQSLLEQTREELAQARVYISTLEASLHKKPDPPKPDDAILRFIINNGWDLYAAINKEMQPVFVSDSVTQVIGYTPEEFINSGVFEMVPPEDRPVAEGYMRQLLENPRKLISYESRIRHKDGNLLWLEVNAINYLDDPEVNLILISSRNITERKLAQLELQASNERYRLLADSLPDSMYVFKVQEDGKPGEVIEVNETACKKLGYTREEFLKLNVLQLDAPNPDKPVLGIIDRLKKGQQVVFEKTHMTREGHPIPVEIHARMGKVGGGDVVFSLARDISWRKSTEEELNLLAAAVQQTDDAIAIASATPHKPPRILFVNEAFSRITGYSRQESLGKSLDFLQLPGTHREDSIEIKALHDKVELGESFRGKTPLYRKDRVKLDIQWSFTPITNSEGVITHFVAVIRDVTEQEQQIQQRQGLQNELQKNQKHLKSLLESMQDAIICMSLTDRQLIFASSSYEKVFGFPIQKYLDDPSFYQKTVPFEDQMYVQEMKEKCLKEGFAEFEHRVIQAGGQVRWLHRRAWVNYDEDGKPSQVNDSASDITEQKQAEELAKRQNAILQQSHDLISLAEMDGKIIYINPAGLEMAGYTEETKVNGKYITDFYSEEDLEHLRMEILPEVLVNGSWRGENRLKTCNGVLIPVDQLIFTVKDEQGNPNYFATIIRDISARKKAEITIRESEQRYRMLAENVTDMIARIGADGRFDYVSPSSKQLLGYKPEELNGLGPVYKEGQLIFHPDDLELTDNKTAGLSKENPTDTAIYRMRHKDGHSIWVETKAQAIFEDNTGQVSGIITSSRDITKRYQAEEAMRASEEKYRSLVESADTLIAMHDAEGTFLYANGILALSVNLSTTEIIGKNICDIYPPESTAQQIAQMQEVFQTGNGNVREVLLVINGEEHWYRASVQPVRDTTGKVSAVLINATDITSLKLTEAALRQTASRLEGLHSLDKEILKARTSQELAAKALETLANQIPFERATVTLIDLKAMTSAIVAIRLGDLLTAVPDRVFRYNPEIFKRFSGSSQSIINLSPDDPFEVFRELYAEGYRTALWVKLEVDGQQIGTVSLYSKQQDVFKEEHLRIAGEVADVVSIGLKTVQLNQQVQQHAVELEDRVAQRTRELENEKNRFEAILNSSSDGILVIKAGTGVMLVNKTYTKLTGFENIDCCGKQLKELFQSPLANSFEKVLETAITQGNLQGLEGYALRRDGSRFAAELSIAPVRSYVEGDTSLVCTIRDITARKEAETALKKSEELYRLLADNITDLVIRVSHDGCYRYTSPSIKTIVGYELEDVIGQPRSSYIHPDDRAMVEAAYKDSLENHKNFGPLVARFRHKNGQYLWLETTGQYVYDENTGEVLELIASSRDVTPRLKAEQALRESETLYRLLADNVTDIVLRAGPDSSYQYISPSVTAVMGYEPAEIIGKSRDDFLHPDDYDKTQKSFETALTNNNRYGPSITRFRHKDGHYLWLETVGKIICDEQTGEPLEIIGSSRDVTSRIKAEQALRESEEIFRQIAENINQVLFVRSADGEELLFANPLYKDLVEGFKENPQATPYAFLGKVHPEDVEFVKQQLASKEYIEEGKLDLEYRMKLTGGKTNWMHIRFFPVRDVNGKLVRRVGLSEDITDRKLEVIAERKQAQDALRQSEERYRTLYETMVQGVIYLDRDGKITGANPAASRILDYPLDQILGTNVRDPFLNVVHEDSTPFLAESFPFITSFTTGQVIENTVMGIHLPWKEEVVWVNLSTVPQFLPGETLPYQVYATFEDITPRKKVEEALAKSQKQFMQAQKLESVGRLAGGIAHDFNNMLTAIMGYASLVEIMLPETENECLKNVGEITKAAQKAAALTRQLLAFGRRQVFLPEPMNLNGAIQEMDQMLRRLLDENIEITNKLEPGLGTVLADPSQLEQVILNLAVNARDAMPKGGRLLVETSNTLVDEENASRYPEMKPGPFVLLTVTDTGLGMSSEVISRIFEPFFTTKEEGKGTGLGLATVYGIVRQSHGFITVYSEVGKGTIFKIYLPRLDKPARKQTGMLPFKGDTSGTETILVVEDDSLLRGLASAVLESKGYKVLVAANGMEATKICEEYNGKIHLLISDLVMPRMGGLELASHLRNTHPWIKLLLMSGYSSEMVDNQELQKADFLQKPYTSTVMLAKVRELLDRD